MEQFNRLQDIANWAAKAADTSRNGVVITVDFDSEYFFLIWTANYKTRQSERLLASVTSEERLIAHAEGFVANL
jgi:hypothetical protein